MKTEICGCKTAKSIVYLLMGICPLMVLIAFPVFRGCRQITNKSDADNRKDIIGTWTIHIGPTGGYSVNGTVTYSLEGNYAAIGMVTDGGKTHEEKFEGWWRIEGGILSETVTNTVGTGLTGTNLPKYFERARVIHVDETSLVLSNRYWDGKGYIIIRHRSNF